MDGVTLFFVVLFILVMAGVIGGQIFPGDSVDRTDVPFTRPWQSTRNQNHEQSNQPPRQQHTSGRSRINIPDYEAQVSPEPDFDDGYPWKPGPFKQINPPQAVPESLRWFGLGRNATKRDVKHKYHEKARELHPDIGGDTRAMQDLNERYEAAIREAR